MINLALNRMLTMGGGAKTKKLVLIVAPEVAPGQYSLEIGLEVKGRNYSTVPCIIEVVE